MSKYPQYEPLRPKYPTKFYQGYYILRDPNLWNTEGRFVPIKRRPVRVRKKPKQMWVYHPWYQMPRMIGWTSTRTRWETPEE